MEPITLAALKKIKWVQDVEKTDSGFSIKTKKDSLKTTLTHSVKDMGGGYGSAYDGRYQCGEILAEPYSLILPQYWIHLKSQGFDFTFAKDPGDNAADYIGFTPTYQGTYSKESWGSEHGVCYGESDRQYDAVSLRDEYCESNSWKERLVIAAMYLQSAEPHYGLTWYRTSYAVRLGLVSGEKFVTISPLIETRRLAEEERTRLTEEQNRIHTEAMAAQTPTAERMAQAQTQQYANIVAQQQNNTAAGPRVFRWTGWTNGNT
jgi:hypothetical protein